jgi:hypothetical protein
MIMPKMLPRLVAGTAPVAAAMCLAKINLVNLDQSEMSLTDFIKRRKEVVHQEGEGINLAIYLINEFKDRRFTLRGLKNKYSGVGGEELLKLLKEEMEEMLILYRYITRAKKYVDRKGVYQVEIKLIGKASSIDRYNPLDIKLDITTETTQE